VPAPAWTQHWLLDGQSNLRRAADRRGRARNLSRPMSRWCMREVSCLRPRGTNRTGDPPPLKTACAAASPVGRRNATRRRRYGPNLRCTQRL